MKKGVIWSCIFAVACGFGLYFKTVVIRTNPRGEVQTETKDSKDGKYRVLMSKQEREDNPLRLVEAFREIRTNKFGWTYAPGYRRNAVKGAIRAMKKGQTQLPWIERGPGNCSGRVRSVLFDPLDSTGNTWFAASVGGGIWKTDDGGANWTNKTPDLLTLSTTCMAISASNPMIMYAGTGMGYGRVVDLAGSGVWKSIDHGETWFQLESTAHGELLPAINRIIVDPTNENLVLLCSNGDYTMGGPNEGDRPSGIFRSTDGGETWVQVFDPELVFGPATDNRVQQLIAEPENFNVIYASVNEVGVVRSMDRGQSWQVSADNFALPQDIGNPPGGASSYQGISVRTELAIAPSAPQKIYAAVERPYGIADLYMSSDRGSNWFLVNDTGADPNWFNGRGISGAYDYTAGWFDNTIVVDPFNSNRVFVGGVSLYRLTVNSNSHQRQSTLISAAAPGYGLSVVHSDMHDLQSFIDLSVPNGFRILNGNDGGVAVSLDGGQSWNEREGINSSQFYGVDKMPGQNRYIGGLQDNGTYLSPLDPDDHSSWTHVLGGDGFEALWNHADPDLILGCSQHATLYRSTDRGNTWSTLSQAVEGNAPFITKLAGSKQDPDLVFSVSEQGIFRSEDFGSSWLKITLPGGWVGHRAFSNVEISPADPRIVWATSRLLYDDYAKQAGGIYVSNDSGLTFEEVTENLPENLTESSGMGFDPEDPDTAYLLFSAAGTPKILRTLDRGQTFEDLSGFGEGSTSVNGFPDVAVYALFVMPFDRDILWAGTEIGLFVSEDDGANWTYSDNGLPRVGIFQITIVDGQIVVATYGRGIWTLDLTELVGYQPPDVPLSPRITDVAFQPTGNLAMNIDLRSKYDHTYVKMNGVPVWETTENDQSMSQTLLLPVQETATYEVQVFSEKDGKFYASSPKQVQTRALSPRKGFSTDFLTSDGLQLTGFTVTQPNGFQSNALHSPHNYSNSSDYICKIESPLLVPEGSALIQYRDMALVEPGTGNGDFGNAQFWDFVVLEGSKDGLNWIPLADGYDARFDSAWLSAYQSGVYPQNESLYRNHTIDVHQTFQPGDQIFIRLRLFADGGVVGWGWAVDDLQIFPTQSSEPISMSERFSFPWLSLNSQFESTLIANNPTNQPVDVVFTARRENGFGEQTAIRTIPALGFLKEDAHVLFPNLEAGVGFTVIMSSESNHLAGRWMTRNLNTGSGGSPSQAVAINLDKPQSQKLLFGFMPVTNGFTSAPAIHALNESASDLILHAFNQQGSQIDFSGYQFEKPNRPFARLVTDLFPEIQEDLYIIAESSTSTLAGTGFVFNQQAEPALGAVTPLFENDNNMELLFPWVSHSDLFESQVVITNLGASSTDCSLKAVRADGTVSEITRSIPGHGFVSESAEQMFPDFPIGPGFSIRVQASQGPIQGRWVTYNLGTASGKSPSQGVAFAGSGDDGYRDWLFGFLPVSRNLISAVAVVNRGEVPTYVDLHFYNSEGEDVGSTTFEAPIEPWQPVALVVNDLSFVGDQDLIAVVHSSQSPVCGVAFIFNQAREPAIGNATPLESWPMTKH